MDTQNQGATGQQDQGAYQDSVTDQLNNQDSTLNNEQQDGGQEGQLDLNGQPSEQSNPDVQDNQGPTIEENMKAMTEGWREDRQILFDTQKENSELKERLAKYEENSDELANLSEEERVNKLVEMRDKDRQLKAQTEKINAEREVRHYRLTDSYFAQNEQRVMQTAVNFNCNSIEDAIKITKSQDQTMNTAQKSGAYNERMKKQTQGAAGAGAHGSPSPGYDPKVDGNKSIGDFYREGLV